MANQVDPVAEANALASLFYDCSAAVDTYRLGANPPLPREQMARLKDESQALSDRAHYFTAQAIGLTLKAIQPDLERIKSVTEQAVEQIRTLEKVDRAITLATTVLSLGTAIAAGNVGSILAAADALAQALSA